MQIIIIVHSMAIRRASLIMNCGYARVYIYENSNPSRKGRNARRNIDIKQRSDQFRSQFCTPTYSIPDEYFTPTSKDHCSLFDRDCTKILDGFRMKFPSKKGHSRESYLDEFSFLKWSELEMSEKIKHTLSNCTQCFEVPSKTHLLPKTCDKCGQGGLTAPRS